MLKPDRGGAGADVTLVEDRGGLQRLIDHCWCSTGHVKFEILDGFDEPLLQRFAAFLAASGIEMAGIEFVRAADGTVYIYDVDTNHNRAAEARVGLSGMGRLADFLGVELDRAPRRPAA
jgi:hypothetical protein